MKTIPIALLFAAITACVAERSPDDATVAPATSNTTPAAGPVLSWSFEPASPDCNGWPVTGAAAIRAIPARTGSYACKLCSDGSANRLELVRDVGSVEPGRYVLDLWVRKREQNAAPPEAHAKLEANVSGNVVTATAPAVAVRDEWDRLQTELEVKAPASNLRITIDAPTTEAKRCLLVDDVVLVRE